MCCWRCCCVAAAGVALVRCSVFSNTITNGTIVAAAYSHGHAHAHDDDDDLDLDLDVDVLSDGLVAAYVGVVMESKVEVVYIYTYICV